MGITEAIIRLWQDEAERIRRNGSVVTDWDIVTLNRLAIAYADRTGKTVPLCGRSPYTPEKGV